MSWADDDLLAFDCETSGVDVFNDRIITVALVKVPAQGRPVALTWLLNADIEIPAEATAIHGVTTERMRAQGKPPEDCLFEITGQLALALLHEQPVVVYNAPFDFSILEAENRRHELPTLAERLPNGLRSVVDPFCIDRHMDQYRKGKRTLAATCEHHRVILAGAHSCAGDALAAARLARVLCQHYPNLTTMSLPELTAAQQAWHAQRQESFRTYLTRSGKDASEVDGSWPVRAAVAEVRA